ncbi:hypothetical protein GHT06_011215 [Daphnia sinensis]|uniref:Alginate lyase 2 domain-containing protein n=1 Tax=Daphnia sinensis TaxID=1820382 RepID=A0AAD5KZQ2_9CRUS|nr:hypothetical protein GHT06_011215 [Daphnia sinensis]
MAVTRPALTFTLLIATALCLMAVKAEEQPAVGEAENRQAKQLYLVPQYYPANTQFYYPADSSPYASAYPTPYAVPAAEAFLGASEDAGYPYGYPSLAFGDEVSADWRHVATGGHDSHRGKWWKKNSHRQATINIYPTGAECVNTNIEDDGLGPCKEASQAEQGVIDIKFSAVGQTAIVGITADSQRHTRVKLICTELTDGMGVFTQTGKIAAVDDTPRVEVGYLQLVATSATDADVLKCSWVSYHHYTAMYP